MSKWFIICAALLILAFDSHGQYFNMRFTLGYEAYYCNNIYVKDTSVFLLGFGLTSYPSPLYKVVSADFSLQGINRSKNYYQLDPSLAYQPERHSIKMHNGKALFIGTGTRDLVQFNRTFHSTLNFDNLSMTYSEVSDTNLKAFFPVDFVVLPSGNLITLGLYDTQQDRISYFIVKTDSSGQELSRTLYPIWSQQQKPSSLTMLRNGNILIGGERGTYNAGSLLLISTQFVEIDTDGNQIKYWSDSVDVNKTNGPCSLIELTNGDKLYAGTYMDSCVIMDPFTTVPLYQGYLVRFDSTYNKLWQLKLGSLTSVTVLNQCKRLSDGNFLAVGSVFDSTVTGGRLALQGGWLIKFTETGQVLWERRYYAADLMYASNVLYDFFEANNGDIFACGEANDNTGAAFGQQGWLLHLNSNGCLNSQCTTGLNDISKMSYEEVYPNPVNNEFKVVLSQDLLSRDHDGVYFKLFDLTGRLVMEHTLTEPVTTINKNEFINGLYIWRVESDHNTLSSGKLIFK